MFEEGLDKNKDKRGEFSKTLTFGGKPFGLCSCDQEWKEKGFWVRMHHGQRSRHGLGLTEEGFFQFCPSLGPNILTLQVNELTSQLCGLVTVNTRKEP